MLGGGGGVTLLVNCDVSCGLVVEAAGDVATDVTMSMMTASGWNLLHASRAVYGVQS